MGSATLLALCGLLAFGVINLKFFRGAEKNAQAVSTGDVVYAFWFADRGDNPVYTLKYITTKYSEYNRRLDFSADSFQTFDGFEYYTTNKGAYGYTIGTATTSAGLALQTPVTTFVTTRAGYGGVDISGAFHVFYKRLSYTLTITGSNITGGTGGTYYYGQELPQIQAAANYQITSVKYGDTNITYTKDSTTNPLTSLRGRMPANDLTITYTTTLLTNNITFDANFPTTTAGGSTAVGHSGSAPATVSNVAYGSSPRIPAMTATCNDFIFEGWASVGETDATTASGFKEYANNAVISNMTTNKKLVAIWKEISFYGGGTGFIKAPTSQSPGASTTTAVGYTVGGLPYPTAPTTFTLPQPISYTITYEHYFISETGSIATQTGINFNLASSGFLLSNWYLNYWTTDDDLLVEENDADDVDYALGESVTLTHDLKLYPRWAQHTITYDANGGTYTSTTTGAVASQLGYGSVTLSNGAGYTRSNYYFNGWATKHPTTGVFTAVSNSYTLSANVTLYAQWGQYTVNYYKNDTNASGSADSQTGTGITLHGASAGFTLTGYHITGWTTTSGGTTATHTLDQTGINANLNLYAVWAINTYTVTFITPNETAISTADVTHGNKVTKPSDPTKTGYTFGGWYKDTAFTTAWDFDSDTVTSSISIYAKWTANTTAPPPTTDTREHYWVFVGMSSGSTYQLWHCYDCHVSTTMASSNPNLPDPLKTPACTGVTSPETGCPIDSTYSGGHNWT